MLRPGSTKRVTGEKPSKKTISAMVGRIAGGAIAGTGGGAAYTFTFCHLQT